MKQTFLIALVVLVSPTFSVEVHAERPAIKEVERLPFRAHCRQLLQALNKLDSLLSVQTIHALTTLLDRPPDEAATAVSTSAKARKISASVPKRPSCSPCEMSVKLQGTEGWKNLLYLSKIEKSKKNYFSVDIVALPAYHAL
jgi:hypothetical protein